MTEPTDAELLALIEKHLGFKPRRDDTVSDPRTGRFHDVQRYRDMKADILAKWGTPPAVAGEAAEHYRNAIARACEGWTMPDGLRKHLETALWSPPTPQPTQAVPPAVREPQCWCLTCRPMRFEDPCGIRMALCPACGNKRCPKANDHRNTCTGSNEPGQPGSAYVGGIKGCQHGAE